MFMHPSPKHIPTHGWLEMLDPPVPDLLDPFHASAANDEIRFFRNSTAIALAPTACLRILADISRPVRHPPLVTDDAPCPPLWSGPAWPLLLLSRVAVVLALLGAVISLALAGLLAIRQLHRPGLSAACARGIGAAARHAGLIAAPTLFGLLNSIPPAYRTSASVALILILGRFVPHDTVRHGGVSMLIMTAVLPVFAAASHFITLLLSDDPLSAVALWAGITVTHQRTLSSGLTGGAWALHEFLPLAQVLAAFVQPVSTMCAVATVALLAFRLSSRPAANIAPPPAHHYHPAERPDPHPPHPQHREHDAPLREEGWGYANPARMPDARRPRPPADPAPAERAPAAEMPPAAAAQHEAAQPAAIPGGQDVIDHPAAQPAP